MALAYAVLAVICLVWLARPADLIGNAHPALKPLKFSLSIALLLASVAVILRSLEASDAVKHAIAATLCLAMTAEIVAIVGQAMRGHPSHFNVSTATDARIWHLMAGAIVVAMISLVALAVVATARPLRFEPVVAAAARIGLWLLLLVAVSGFAMGGRGSHQVGRAGDLRVPHFFAMHGLQVLPLCALVLTWLPLDERTRWFGFAAVSIAWIGIAIGTLVQAFAGRALL